MPLNLSKTHIFHITNISNLADILASGGLYADSTLSTVNVNPTVIGFSHIKQRRLTEITVPCTGNKFVGEFVPFYFCPRSPMLYTINRGNSDRIAGCQKDIVHLYSSVEAGVNLGKD